MRHVFGLLLASCVLQAVSAQGQAPSDEAIITANDVLAGRLWRIAAATHTRIGFEATDHVSFRGRLKDVPPFSVSTLDDGLNAAVGADDRYEWRKGDVVLVRPKRAWDDPTNPFNRRMRNVQVANAPPIAVLRGLRDLIYTDRFAITPITTTTDIPVSFSVQSGTVIDVLNQLMVAADLVLWTGSYRRHGQPAERFPRWDLSLAVSDRVQMNSWSSGQPPARK
jgi:hypothetical protein